MGLIDELYDRLKDKADIKSVRSLGLYRVLSMMFKYDFFNDVTSIVDDLTIKAAVNGERIKCRLSYGEVVDMGLKSIDVIDGFYIELYNYQSTTVYHIRIYRFKNKDREWCALYVDENPETPWWIGDERI
ncbi:MAG: hypothetical protein QXY40_04580 [Candidatus Methanomethylicia archaeon]